MGGPGSGSWYRWDSKPTTESQKRIDIRWFNKMGYLRPNAIGSLTWSIQNRKIGAIDFRVEEDRLMLFYRYRLSGEEWSEVEQAISLDLTPCNYGGNRKWFLCPGCGRRVAILYGAGKYFHCRYCYGLTYSSQQESEPDRLMRKVRKIRRQLGGSDISLDAFPLKPKSMHWKTYWRMRDKAEQAANDSLQIMAQRHGVCV